jgi:4-hydroxy-tetrahydrodipicolinate synthase
LFAAVAKAVTIPVIAGTGSNDTAHSVHLTKEASALGVAGILAVCPYYNRPSQAGIEAHIRAMSAATTLPVVVYDIPVRTGRKISTTTLATLANDVKNLVGVKDAAGNPGESARLMTMTPSSFELISGDDGLTLPLMAVGCTAVIGVATHWSGIDHQEMFIKWNAGDVAGVAGNRNRGRGLRARTYGPFERTQGRVGRVSFQWLPLAPRSGIEGASRTMRCPFTTVFKSSCPSSFTVSNPFS